MIDTKKFFIYGVICFSIIFVCNFINFFIFYSSQNFFGHISSAAGVLFNLITAGFFFYMHKQYTLTSGSEGGEGVDIGKFNEAIKEFEDVRKRKTGNN